MHNNCFNSAHLINVINEYHLSFIVTLTITRCMYTVGIYTGVVHERCISDGLEFFKDMIVNQRQAEIQPKSCMKSLL